MNKQALHFLYTREFKVHMFHNVNGQIFLENYPRYYFRGKLVSNNNMVSLALHFNENGLLLAM